MRRRQFSGGLRTDASSTGGQQRRHLDFTDGNQQAQVLQVWLSRIAGHLRHAQGRVFRHRDERGKREAARRAEEAVLAGHAGFLRYLMDDSCPSSSRRIEQLGVYAAGY